MSDGCKAGRSKGVSEYLSPFLLLLLCPSYIRIISELSKGLWQEIGKDPNDALERLALGSEGQHWGVSRDKSGTYWTFSNVKGSLRGQLDKLSRSQFSGDFWFVALGVGDSFSYSVNGTPCTRSHDDGLKAALERARMNGKTVMVS